jgi:hypothetical protein
LRGNVGGMEGIIALVFHQVLEVFTSLGMRTAACLACLRNP